MKGYTKNYAAPHGNEVQKSKCKKHDANLRKNGLLHFQIGLIVSLLTVYLALEAAFPYLNPEVALADEKVYVIDEDPVPDFTVYQEPEKVLEEPKVEKKIPPVESHR